MAAVVQPATLPPTPLPSPLAPPPRPNPRPVTVAPVLSVVVVNFRQWPNTVALTRQLDASENMRSGQAEVVVVDNDAEPHPLRRRVRQRAGVSLRCFGRNRGFARAVNEGCRLSRGRWILLLNPDVRVPEEFLDQVLTTAEQLAEDEPRAGVVGFELRHADGSRQGSSGPFPTLWNVLFGLVRARARRRCRPLRSRGRREVPWVTGCCLLVRRDCWHDLGGFDEDFFLYYEDADLCRRARSRGWSVWYEPGLRVTHFHPLHVRAVSPALRLMTRHALLTYAAKHWPRWQFRVLGAVIAAEAGVRQRFAHIRGQNEAAGHFARLRALTADLLRSRGVRARQQLLRTARALTPSPTADTTS